MRKYVTLGIFVILFVFILTGCEENSYKETEIQTAVIQCEEGTYHPNASYEAIARMYFSQGKYAMSNVYKNLAKANGKYDYDIAISIEGKKYTVVRSEQYEVGQTISVTKVETYDKDSKLIKTEYK